MIPDDMRDEHRANLLDPAIMGQPIVWLASADAAGDHDERICRPRLRGVAEEVGEQRAGQYPLGSESEARSLICNDLSSGSWPAGAR
jgi:hypothetical protein